MKEMFLGGIGPGILLVALTAWWGIRKGPRDISARTPFQAREAWAALWDAKWEVLIPFVAVGALFKLPTTTEAAAVTATYSFLVATVVHRDLRFKDLPRVITQCGLLVGGVLLILGVALGFTHYLVDAQVPDSMAAWATSMLHSKWLFLLCLNLVLILVGGDRNLRRDHSRGAAPRPDRRRLWVGPDPSRNHFPREHGTRIPRASCGLKPVAVIVPL
jgi:TRAP-type C4-dicarboxylate transport system permease large subunit